MIIPHYFFSCDWGTSQFRLRLIESKSLDVLGDVQTDQGVKSIFRQYKTQTHLSQLEFFCHYLSEQLTQFSKQHQDNLVILSGMASSSIGLMELAYAEMPIVADASNLNWKYIEEGTLRLLLISGAKTKSDVMRGEEIQLIGLADDLITTDGMVILPGTHSKHVTIKDGAFIDCKTYMTGELFNVISTHSILSNSLLASEFSSRNKQAFLKGMDIGLDGDMTRQLFSIRANQLLHSTSEDHNYYLLSGMIIGDELSVLRGYNKSIHIAASEPLLSMYTLGLKYFVEDSQLNIFTDKRLEQATLKGQHKLLAIINKLTI